MKKIFVVGGNGFARECAYRLKTMEFQEDICFSGYLGHGGYGHTVDYKGDQAFYRGEVADHVFAEDEYVVIGAGYPDLRTKIYNDLKAQKVKFYTLIERGVFLSPSFEYGEANIFMFPFYSTVDIKVGNGNVFNGDIIIGHDCEIGDFNFFGPRSQLLGNVKVGNYNTVGTNVVFLPKAKVGNNNKIAPLSAIYKGCKDNGYYLGNPALKEGNV